MISPDITIESAIWKLQECFGGTNVKQLSKQYYKNDNIFGLN